MIFTLICSFTLVSLIVEADSGFGLLRTRDNGLEPTEVNIAEHLFQPTTNKDQGRLESCRIQKLENNISAFEFDMHDLGGRWYGYITVFGQFKGIFDPWFRPVKELVVCLDPEKPNLSGEDHYFYFTWDGATGGYTASITGSELTGKWPGFRFTLPPFPVGGSKDYFNKLIKELGDWKDNPTRKQLNTLLDNLEGRNVGERLFPVGEGDSDRRYFYRGGWTILDEELDLPVKDLSDKESDDDEKHVTLLADCLFLKCIKLVVNAYFSQFDDVLSPYNAYLETVLELIDQPFKIEKRDFIRPPPFDKREPVPEHLTLFLSQLSDSYDILVKECDLFRKDTNLSNDARLMRTHVHNSDNCSAPCKAETTISAMLTFISSELLRVSNLHYLALGEKYRNCGVAAHRFLVPENGPLMYLIMQDTTKTFQIPYTYYMGEDNISDFLPVV